MLAPLRLPHLAVLVLGVSAGLAACGGDDAPATTSAPATTPATTTTRAAGAAPRTPALCRGALRVRVTGRVAADGATELSGLVASPTQAGVLWTHNDSGDTPRLFALRADGSAIATVAVTGAEAVDWEDLAAGPGGTLLIADIGDNDAVRDAVTVHRVAEPRVGGALAPAAAVPLTLRYPDGAHDAETLLADRRTGEVVVVTKAISGRSVVYAGRLPGGGAVAEERLRRVGTLELGFGGLATGGSVSADGATIAIRTYTAARVWRRAKATTSIARTITAGRGCVAQAALGREGQGEAIALSRDGRAFFTVPEGAAAALRRYTTRNP